MGFEPTVEFPLNTLYKRAPSATRPSLPRPAYYDRSILTVRRILAKLWLDTFRVTTARHNGARSNHYETLLNGSAFLGLVQLLSQVVFVGHLRDRVQLAFQPIDVVFFVF